MTETETETEHSLHVKYASKRLRGEWFSLSDEDVAEIKMIKKDMRGTP